MGSDTILVACEKLGLCGTGIEINEKYFDTTCRRVEEILHKGLLVSRVMPDVVI